MNSQKKISQGENPGSINSKIIPPVPAHLAGIIQGGVVIHLQIVVLTVGTRLHGEGLEVEPDDIAGVDRDEPGAVCSVRIEPRVARAGDDATVAIQDASASWDGNKRVIERI